MILMFICLSSIIVETDSIYLSYIAILFNLSIISINPIVDYDPLHLIDFNSELFSVYREDSLNFAIKLVTR